MLPNIESIQSVKHPAAGQETPYSALGGLMFDRSLDGKLCCEVWEASFKSGQTPDVRVRRTSVFLAEPSRRGQVAISAGVRWVLRLDEFD